MNRFRLLDGTEVYAPSLMEARVIDHEVGETNTYFQHGIVLPSEPCIMDVGANAGLFAVRMWQRNPGLSLYCFEPIASVFAMLEANVAEHCAAARVKSFNIALGSSAGEAIFEMDPKVTFTASMSNEAVEASIQKDITAHAFARAALGDLARAHLMNVGWARRLHVMVEVPVLGWLIAGPLWWLAQVEKRRGKRRLQRLRCPVQTLSSVFESEQVARVDLLKVDVEGAEESVLQGIQGEHWPRIRQVVAEVHDANGRAARMRRLLESHGFDTVLDQQDWEMHRLLGIFTIYATRPPVAP